MRSRRERRSSLRYGDSPMKLGDLVEFNLSPRSRAFRIQCEDLMPGIVADESQRVH